MRPALAAVAEQQKIINALRDGFSLITEAAGISGDPRIQAVLAGSDPTRLAEILKAADVDNPAQPIPDPGSEPATETSEQALAPAGTDDPTSVGASPVNDVSADATTSVDATGTVLDQPLDLNEDDPTKPVSGTEGPQPLSDVKIETEVRSGTGTNDVSFPLQGPFAERATTGSVATETAPGASEGRQIASLRLARLRVAANIATGDDLTLASAIASSGVPDEMIQHEIDTLAQVTQAASRVQRAVPRSLVPRAASAVDRTTPSFQAEPQIPIQSVAYAPEADEFAFE